MTTKKYHPTEYVARSFYHARQEDAAKMAKQDNLLPPLLNVSTWRGPMSHPTPGMYNFRFKFASIDEFLDRFWPEQPSAEHMKHSKRTLTECLHKASKVLSYQVAFAIAEGRIDQFPLSTKGDLNDDFLRHMKNFYGFNLNSKKFKTFSSDLGQDMTVKLKKHPVSNSIYGLICTQEIYLVVPEEKIREARETILRRDESATRDGHPA